MADPKRRRLAWRPVLRAVHRDLGYTAVGLTMVYALSGLAVNHVADWDPNFHNYATSHELGGPLPDDDETAARLVREKLAIPDEPREVYRAGNELEIVFEHRTLHADAKTGHVDDEGQKPRFLLRFANWLHLNRGKKAWTYAADTFAVGLLVLAATGLFMLPGRRGILGRGALFVLLGIAIPVVYVTLAHP